MKILLASSEVHPFSKTGGLADMAGSLAKALYGHRVGVVTPLYAGIRERYPEIKKMDWQMDLPLGGRWVHAEVWTLPLGTGHTAYFIHNPEFYHRAGLYNDRGADYADNAERFIFFSKAVVQLARYLPWQPELVHANDWQTGLVPLLIAHQKKTEGWTTAPRTCFTIHNLAYQGIFPGAQYTLANLPPEYFNPLGAEFYGQLNCLKAGILYADAITTVSPRYAREITTPQFGHHLDDLLRRRQRVLFGILNGVDAEEWTTVNNPCLKYSFSIRNLAGKTKNKLALQKELGLPSAPAVPMFGTISRLTGQKGLDIELGALEEMLGADIQFVLLGSGDPMYENAYRKLAARHPRKVAVKIGFDQGLSHRIEAGCDFYLMPSLFEPCGLNQMYSLRYGTIPIVRITGGLDDSVIDVTEDETKANGIKFAEFSPRVLAKAMRKALVIYQNKNLLRHYQRNAMACDFSWDATVKHYLRVYQGKRP